MIFYVVFLLIFLEVLHYCTPVSLSALQKCNLPLQQSQFSVCGCQKLSPNLPNYNPNCCNSNQNPVQSCNCSPNYISPTECPQDAVKPTCSSVPNCGCPQDSVKINYEGKSKCFTSRFKNTCGEIESAVWSKVDRILCFARGLMKKLNLAMDVRVNLGTDCEPEVAVRLTHPLCLQLHKNCKLYVERSPSYNSMYGE